VEAWTPEDELITTPVYTAQQMTHDGITLPYGQRLVSTDFATGVSENPNSQEPIQWVCVNNTELDDIHSALGLEQVGGSGRLFLIQLCLWIY
jgi:hypothetical protein